MQRLACSAYYHWFTDPAGRLHYPESDHAHQSRTQVAELRVAVSAGGADQRATTIGKQLRELSPEFVSVSDRHEVSRRFDDHKTIVHSELGDIEVDCQALFVEDQA